MNWAGRAAIGAFLGALAVLMAHPKSRPFLLSDSFVPGRSQAVKHLRSLPENMRVVPSPTNLGDAALCLRVGAERILRNRGFTVDDALTCGEIALTAEDTDPDNGFWSQMRSAFASRGILDPDNRRRTMLEAWYRASSAARWDDYQTDRLTVLCDDLRRASQVPFAWHNAVAYWRKSSADAQFLLLHSRSLTAESPDSLELRVSNILNGSLIRDGARSVQGSGFGSSMVEFAAGSVGRPIGTARNRAETRGLLMQELAEAQPGSVGVVSQILQANDAWNATQPVQSASSRALTLTRWSLVTSMLPACCLVSGLIGFGAWLVGLWLDATKGWRRVLGSSLAVWIGLAVGLIVFLASRLVFPALWSFVAFSLFCVRPDRLRPGPPMNLGLVYQGVLAFLAVWVAMATSGFLLEHSVAASLLSSDAALPGPEDPASSIPLYLIYLGLSLVLATAPAWGFFYRFEAAAVLPGSLKRFGTLLGMGGLAMAVVSAPVCIAVDGSLRTQLGELFQNEPYHYFVSAGKT